LLEPTPTSEPRRNYSPPHILGPRLRWFKFSLRSLLVVVALLGVLLGAWVAWPLQTSRHFFSLIERGEYDRARRFLSETTVLRPDGDVLSGRNWSVLRRSDNRGVWLDDTGMEIAPVTQQPQREPRSSLEILRGRATFRIGDGMPDLLFVVERGRITVVAILRSRVGMSG